MVLRLAKRQSRARQTHHEWPMSNRSRHIYSASHDNRRQTERNEACFNCRGAKEEKQSLKEPSAKECYTAQPTPNRASFELAQGWPRCEGGRQYVNVASLLPAVRLLERQSRTSASLMR